MVNAMEGSDEDEGTIPSKPKHKQGNSSHKCRSKLIIEEVTRPSSTYTAKTTEAQPSTRLTQSATSSAPFPASCFVGVPDDRAVKLEEQLQWSEYHDVIQGHGLRVKKPHCSLCGKSVRLRRSKEGTDQEESSPNQAATSIPNHILSLNL